MPEFSGMLSFKGTAYGHVSGSLSQVGFGKLPDFQGTFRGRRELWAAYATQVPPMAHPLLKIEHGPTLKITITSCPDYFDMKQMITYIFSIRDVVDGDSAWLTG
jgi:hypothetical protein